MKTKKGQKIISCRHCGLEIEEAPVHMDWMWIHTNGWYGCDIARQFAGIRGLGLLGDDALAEPVVSERQRRCKHCGKDVIYLPDNVAHRWRHSLGFYACPPDGSTQAEPED